MTNESVPSRTGISILLADSKQIENQLLTGALSSRGFEVFPCDANIAAILELAEKGVAQVVVISCAGVNSAPPDMAALRTLHLTYPHIPKVFLMEVDDREVAVQAFRFGARGIFCLADSSFQLLCECIERVYRGEICATTQQLNYLLDALCQVAPLHIASAGGVNLLTSREEQVVALVSDGLSNRSVAGELGLSEHTVKKYLFRIFDKLGISSRVELVLYAVHHGSPSQAGWMGAPAQTVAVPKIGAA
jgi:DNA-binding NarL/FixJ family response regulator